MQAKTPPSSDTAKQSANQPEQEMKAPPGPYVGRPLDGSQYLDVVEEQEYADRPPTQEEQRPRYSYLKEGQRPKQ